ncbi:amino acid ABC transporter ATP-binding protein [Mesorhizobium sp. WSM4887]|uniref:amino acid ABC transporter ATP-binding protein n=1 Tax=Mesorhizobium sp. WSM4887 TaxID=3038543 RepID=UPI0024167770|nr:amino acid ABC transporter ATP-binding protein [Mesorhizobium sp. WSM4887]MDG4889846.1 amino acid ABC transporter ATP-binding protein [Mesorhizobium sp. WSM4887]
MEKHPGDAPVLKISGLVKQFGNRIVINGVDLDVVPGEVVVIIGPSGTGKSTMLRCVNGLEDISDGTITFEGEQVRTKTREIVHLRRRIGMIFQNFNLYPHLTALENVMLAPMKVLKQPRKQVEERSRDLFRKVRLEHRCDAYPGQLSGGEQQRVAIARTLAMEPHLMLFDEPTSALDPETVGDVLRVMEDLAREGRTMLVVTHEIGFARHVGSRMIFMDGGKIVEDRPPREMIADPANPRTKQFLSSILQH